MRMLWSPFTKVSLSETSLMCEIPYSIRNSKHFAESLDLWEHVNSIVAHCSFVGTPELCMASLSPVISSFAIQSFAEPCMLIMVEYQSAEWRIFVGVQLNIEYDVAVIMCSWPELIATLRYYTAFLFIGGSGGKKTWNSKSYLSIFFQFYYVIYNLANAIIIIRTICYTCTRTYIP